MNTFLRYLPKVDEILKDYDEKLKENFHRDLILNLYRRAIDKVREKIINGDYNEDMISIGDLSNEDSINKIEKFLSEKVKAKFNNYLISVEKPKLKPVVNGLGTILHTNLGRAVLSKRAQDAVCQVAKGYSNVEYQLDKGKRGNRTKHIEEMLKSLTGAEDTIVVNNNAAAIMLVLNSLCKDKECIISRGELVEIGGSFRIPDVMNFSGSKLIEVGTTNRTNSYDYEDAINSETAAILKVHKSNYDIIGFSSEVRVETLMEIGNEFKIPIIEDLGSGTFEKLNHLNISEPTVSEEIEKGVDILTFSGDKLLGGPQAGIIVGKKKYINRIKKNQLLRTLRIDKFTIAALEATLIEYRIKKEKENIPTLNMILKSKDELKTIAENLKSKLDNLQIAIKVKLKEEASLIGGGAMPRAVLDTYSVWIGSEKYNEVELEEKLRTMETPILTRVKDKGILIDVRTLLDFDLEKIEDAIRELHL